MSDIRADYGPYLLTLEQLDEIERFSFGESPLANYVSTNQMLALMENMGFLLSTAMLERLMPKLSSRGLKLKTFGGNRVWEPHHIQLLVDYILDGELDRQRGRKRDVGSGRGKAPPFWLMPHAAWLKDRDIPAWGWAQAHVEFAQTNPHAIEASHEGETISRMIKWHEIPLGAVLVCGVHVVGKFRFVPEKDIKQKFPDMLSPDRIYHYSD